MTAENCIKFNEWYKALCLSAEPYNNKEQLTMYCVQDVSILRLGCTAFMTNFYTITGVNPMLESFTLPQAVMIAYRKQYMEENMLGIVPTSLYHEMRKNQSREGLKWLIYEAQKRTANIIYEVNIPTTKYYVDGFCKETNTVFEFLGCYWHGCERCFLNRSKPINSRKEETFDVRYHQTCLRLDTIASLGYKIIHVWSCRFKKLLNKNSDIAATLENDPKLLHKYLHPRDANHGGRVEAVKMYYKILPGQKIRFLDFTSLYPCVNKKDKNPIRHPAVHYNTDCDNLDITNMDGLIKCSVLPRRDLLIPVLPTKINNKLIFTLCQKCAETENVIAPCSHNEMERMLTDTWALAEVHLSVKYGYKICKIYEVWEYEISQYDEHTKTGGVFTDFMNCFLKLKQEASDWPPNVSSETEKASFIEEFLTNEGIQLDPLVIKSNPSQRACSKLILNALWGKFIQKNDRSQTSIIQNKSELYMLVASDGIVITDIIAIEDVLWVSWKYLTEDFVEPLKHVSLAIGAFTTANARIRLYRELCKIPEKVLYCDTDSIIFIEDESNKGALKTGNFIGELTNEISSYGKNAYITEFASTGPKSYGYVVFDPDRGEHFEIAKCKGVTLNMESCKVLNFSTLKNMVINCEDEGFREIHNNKKIKRKKLLKVVSEPESKKFGFTYLKRVCLENFDTVPYGFQILPN